MNFFFLLLEYFMNKIFQNSLKKRTHHTLNSFGEIDTVYLILVNTIPKTYSKKTITGNFTSNHLNLKNLQNCPKIVKGDFRCNNNRLISLENGPEFIGGMVRIDDNMLASLEGSPKSVGSPYGGDFYCDINNLKSLYKISKNINGFISCTYNSLFCLDFLCLTFEEIDHLW